MIKKTFVQCLFFFIAVIFCHFSYADGLRTVKDAAGRTVAISEKVTRIICSGSGCLRLLTYVGAHNMIVAVDSIEVRGSPIDARPYAIANPQFKKYPLFGEFRGNDNPELIAALDPKPQVIFKTVYGKGQNPDLLQAKTGIPVIVLEYGNLTWGRESLNSSLRLIGTVMGKTGRAEEVIAFFDMMQKDLIERTQNIREDKKPLCYVGGLGRNGPHGFQSTDPSFAPFVFTGVKNIAALLSKKHSVAHAVISMEKIILADPEVIFLDASTLRLGSGLTAFDQLCNNPAYAQLQALKNRKIYALFPNVSYNQNFETVFANSYYIGKVLFPENFADIEPMAKAEEISVFLNGSPSFQKLNRQFDGLAFSRLRKR